jgi:5-methyltetrahydropteroyltriglutamate--homocysteine methyltransferase
MAVHPESPQIFLDLIGQTFKGITVRKGLHLCFGNYMGRPVARRRYRHLFPSILEAGVDELALEFANRELAELDIARPITEAGITLASGVIDVKNYYIETPDDVVERIQALLK